MDEPPNNPSPPSTPIPPESEEQSIDATSVEENLTEDPSIQELPLDLDALEDASPLEIQLGLEDEQLILVLPTTKRHEIEDWEEVWVILEQHLEQHQEFPVLNVTLLAQNQLLGGRQLQQLSEVLNRHQLQLKRIRTSRRQTAIAAATAGYGVEQEPLAQLIADIPSKLEPVKPAADGSYALYVTQTVRSGVEIRHKGSIIVTGDVNPGGVIIADDDIVIWGCLRGVAHAGANGDRSCRIMALQMHPTQLRIADIVARSSASSPDQIQPEVAYLTSDGIRLAPALKFSKNYVYDEDAQNWEEMPDPMSL